MPYIWTCILGWSSSFLKWQEAENWTFIACLLPFKIHVCKIIKILISDYLYGTCTLRDKKLVASENWTNCSSITNLCLNIYCAITFMTDLKTRIRAKRWKTPSWYLWKCGWYRQREREVEGRKGMVLDFTHVGWKRNFVVRATASNNACISIDDGVNLTLFSRFTRHFPFYGNYTFHRWFIN